jgi:hypothetical protein
MINTGKGTRTFRLIVGSKSFAEANSMGIDLFPKNYVLYQNYPNPFNPSTTIRFDVPRMARVCIRIFNVLGEEIADVADGFYTAGVHQVVWDGRTQYGRSAGSGVYFVRLESGTFTDTKKIILLK